MKAKSGNNFPKNPKLLPPSFAKDQYKKILDKCFLLYYSPIRVLGECHMKTEKDKVTIKIPRPIYENLGKIIEGGGFNSVTEFIVYILRDLISSRPVKKEPSLTREEIEMVKKRLKSLGYL
jgi:Arc/MetJ-type ribon-helix-helix transcriptional regulator